MMVGEVEETGSAGQKQIGVGDPLKQPAMSTYRERKGRTGVH